jgi:DNA adenine methylase
VSAPKELAEAQPIIKWAGGKRHLEEAVLRHLDKNQIEIGDYYEPFLGGGAIFFALAKRGLIKRAYLSDTNENLVILYLVLGQSVDALLEKLEKLDRLPRNAKTYYERRDRSFHDSYVSRVAHFIYLNKLGYNGLYRVNKQGEFNVPYGGKREGSIFDEKIIRAASAALVSSDAYVEHQKFGTALDGLLSATKKQKPFAYLDPPYLPLNNKSFTAYQAAPFGRFEHAVLAAYVHELNRQGKSFLLSNADTPEARKLYRGLTVKTIQARRSINRDASARGKINELLVSNQPQKP